MSTLWPFIVLGLFGGAVYGLGAVGLVLTYKTAGVFNFAYGGVAMFCAYMTWQLNVGWGLPLWLAIVIVILGLAPAMGLICDYLFRPLRGSSTEVQLVVALAILAFLQGLALLIYGSDSYTLPSVLPTTTIQISTLYLGWNQIGTLLIALALVLGLGALLWMTRFGLATRSVVNNPQLAGLMGVNDGSVSRAAWIISSMFAAVMGILLSNSQGLNVSSLVDIVTFAFAPAVLGRLSSLPVAFIGGLVLGVITSVLSKWSASGTVSDIENAVPYLALLILLMVYGSRLRESKSSIRDVAQESEMGSAGRRQYISTGIFAALLILVPVLTGGSTLLDITEGAAYAIIASSLVLTMGWAGQISLAQFSFAGIGAFTVAHLGGSTGGTFFLALFAGAAIAIPFGILVGLPALRLSGLYLALATLAFALTMDNLVFPRNDVSGGAAGITVPRPRIGGLSLASPVRFYYVVLVALALVTAVLVAVRRGGLGRRLRAMRDSPLAAEIVGINLTATKLGVFGASAVIAAIGGALYASLATTVSPTDFQLSTSLELVLLLVLAGRSLIAGAFMAGAVFTIQLLPVFSPIEGYLPLGIAIGAGVLAQSPEGSLALNRKQFIAAREWLRSTTATRRLAAPGKDPVTK